MAPPTYRSKLNQLSAQFNESKKWRENERKEVLWKSLVDL